LHHAPLVGGEANGSSEIRISAGAKAPGQLLLSFGTAEAVPIQSNQVMAELQLQLKVRNS
jgi:hypothetical protein